MRIRITAIRTPLPASAEEEIRRRAAFALGRFAPRIEWLSLRFADANGPRHGGLDCIARIRLREPAGELIVHGAADKPVEGAGRLLERVRGAVHRHLARTLLPR